mgnify:CR=1 FL=1
MTRDVRSLTVAECWGLLGTTDLGRLAGLRRLTDLNLDYNPLTDPNWAPDLADTVERLSIDVRVAGPRRQVRDLGPSIAQVEWHGTRR